MHSKPHIPAPSSKFWRNYVTKGALFVSVHLSTGGHWNGEIYVNVVFVIRCLYSAVSLTLLENITL